MENYWFAFHDLLSLLVYDIQDYLPRGSTAAHWGPGPFPLISQQNNLPRKPEAFLPWEIKGRGGGEVLEKWLSPEDACHNPGEIPGLSMIPFTCIPVPGRQRQNDCCLSQASQLSLIGKLPFPVRYPISEIEVNGS